VSVAAFEMLHKSSEANVDGTLYLSIFLTDSCSHFLHALKFPETNSKELNPKLIWVAKNK
jgi:hypothetical protein